MRVWLPSLEGDGHDLLELSDRFSFEYIDEDIIGDELKITKLAVGTLTDCRFQILFEIALNHMVKGQYRDAMVAGHTALERYREFYLLTGFLEKGFDLPVVARFWSAIGKQSERQLGAYHTMILLREQRVAKELGNSHVKYRNKVIHQGYFPDKGRTGEYLRAILETIFDGLYLRLADNNFVLQAKEFEYSERKPGVVDIEYSMNPLLRLAEVDFDELLDDFVQRISSLEEDLHQNEIIWPYV